MARKYKARSPSLTRPLGSLARFLLKSQLLTVFLVLCALGVYVGVQTRPDPHVVPYAELFGQMGVVSYRESPSDTTARFVAELTAGGKVFRRYDVDARSFLPPARDRDYNRAITGTFYRPLQVRGHVAQGLWLDVPRHSGPSLLPEQFDELYRATLDFVKPISVAAGVLGTLSGYSVGYRLGIWNSSLRSRAVQERVLATPDLGRVITREAWRRVLLEPVVMSGEDDATRFAAIRGTQRIYTNLFRIALNDSDGFIPREAERLERLGHADRSRAMLAFAEAVRRAALDSVHVASADFSAVERWASLLVRRGHWAHDAIPPAGEERTRYLGMLAWYGVAPPAPEVDRVWVGPRMLVREGETEGFVADDVPATGVGCPIAWRALLQERKTHVNALASAWFSDHPEFTALAAFAARVAGQVADAARDFAARPTAAPSASEASARDPARAATAGFTSRVTIAPGPAPPDSGTLPHAAADTLRAPGASLVPMEAVDHGVGSGPPADTKHWNVGIRRAGDSTVCFARLRLAPTRAISTTGEHESLVSGGGATGRTLATPTARPSEGLVSVTVLAPVARAADPTSAEWLAVGVAEAKRRARERPDLSAILVERGTDGVDTIWVESDLRESFELEGICGARVRVEFY